MRRWPTTEMPMLCKDFFWVAPDSEFVAIHGLELSYKQDVPVKKMTHEVAPVLPARGARR
jgi:hypothetical protein